MNKKIIFWIIYYFTAMLCQAQIQDNTVWTEYDINTQNSSINSKRQYWVANDTIINGRTYKKVVDNNRYIGAIREENGKIYAYLNYGDYLLMEDEFLLYDFTVQAGDVIRSTAFEGALSNPDELTVIQIDEVTLENGEKRKRFFFDGTDPWIEGIGSTGGLFHDAMWRLTNYTVSYLVCFQSNNISVYIDDVHCLDGRCCEDNNANNDKTIFPESDAIWNIQINGQEHYYGLSGDTIIEGIKYNKLYLLNDTTLNINHQDTYVGGFRIAGKQVWFLPHEIYNPYEREFLQLQEYVLYDFSKNIGETINLSNIPVFPLGDAGLVEFHGLRNIAYTVATIEDSSIGKIFDLGEVKWAEGIGSISNGILWDFYDLTTNVGNATVKLACFKQGDNIVYMNNDCSSCFCYKKTVSLSNDIRPVFSVFYNQKISSIQIDTNDDLAPYSFELINIQGNRIFQEDILTTHKTIPINSMKGVYIYRLSTPNPNVQIGKIIL